MSMDRKEVRRLKMQAERKFDRLAALREEGAHREATRMSDHWGKRISTNTAGFFNPKRAKEVRRECS